MLQIAAKALGAMAKEGTKEIVKGIAKEVTETVKETAKEVKETAKETAKEAVKDMAKDAVEKASVEVAKSCFPKFFDSASDSRAEVRPVQSGDSQTKNKMPDFFKNAELDSRETVLGDVDSNKMYSPNASFEAQGHAYETDDTGRIYKVDGKLNPESSYTVNGITYPTDALGRKVEWSGEPGYNPEARRDGGAQAEAGGEDRKPGDDGGHLVARVLNGSSGIENIVAMRDTINRGDYKRSENEIADAKIQGKEVHDSGRIFYSGESSRPDKIERTYEIDGMKKQLIVDNVEGSQALLNDVKDNISSDDYHNLEDRIKDMEADKAKVSVTSVLKEYDADGNVVSATVGIRDETSSMKTYIKMEGV